MRGFGKGHPLARLNARRKQGGNHMAGQEDLGVKVNDTVRTIDGFGIGDKANLDKQIKGTGGTLHLTKPDDAEAVGKLAIELSRQTRLPVIIVVKGF